MRTFEQAQEEAMPTPKEPTDNAVEFPGGLKPGDIVRLRATTVTDRVAGSVLRTAYDTEGEPLVVVRWPHVGTLVEAPDDLVRIPVREYPGPAPMIIGRVSPTTQPPSSESGMDQ